MAQTRKKRRTKHRGTAAGTIETRGRTGRKPTKEESKGGPVTRTGAKREAQPRKNRYDKPPTWKGALLRSAMVTVVLFLVLAFVLKQRPITGAVGACVVLMVIYVPFNYYTDRFFYRRRQAKLASARSAPRRPRGEQRTPKAEAPAPAAGWRRLLGAAGGRPSAGDKEKPK